VTDSERDAFDAEIRRTGKIRRDRAEAQERLERLAIRFASDMLRGGATDVDIVEYAAWKLAGKFVLIPAPPPEPS
jgi:hypothetical protein